MKIIKILVLTFVVSSVLFAQTGGKSGGNLGFKQGDDEFAFGFLAGIYDGEGYGIIPVVWDRGAFGGMFSFGAEARLWWAKYYYGTGNYSSWYGYEIVWNGDYRAYGFWRNARFYPIDYLVNEGGYPYLLREREYTKLGVSSSFRVAFHPFGMPALKGQVKAAKHIDPYAGVKIGLSIISLDSDDPFKEGNPENGFDFPVFSWYMAGIRWYFKDGVSLWTEVCRYDWSIGFSFKF